MRSDRRQRPDYIMASSHRVGVQKSARLDQESLAASSLPTRPLTWPLTWKTFIGSALKCAFWLTGAISRCNI